ncbi:MAG: S-layer homology domain-containing protein [Syntrophomonas sp.]|nr:S-layer homology domain-containing protein [Syntrophomonas sp.]
MKQVNYLKKHLVVLLTLVMIAGMISPAAAVKEKFSDINSHWAETTIKTWLDGGLINAYPDGMFKPDSYVSRAEFITMTNHAFYFTKEASHSFNDVKDGDWHSSEICKGIQAGYIKGYSDGTMRPDSPVTRQEAAAILARLLDLSPKESRAELLTDAEGIPSWSKGAIGSMLSSGIMKGYPDGRFGPAAEMTRAEAVVALEKGRNHTIAFETAGTYGPAQGKKTICGHVLVKADGAILQNLIITGNLIITEEVGNGDVTLNDIIVYGETFIRGGGKDSIHINGGVFKKVVVQNVKGQVRIVATAVNGLAVVIAEDAAGEAIILEGNFASVVLENVSVGILTQGRTRIDQITVRGSSDSPIITLSERTTVSSMVLETKADIKGTGTVVKAEIKADGVSFERLPSEQEVAPGVNPPATTPPSTTSGGSGSGGSSDYSPPPPLVIPETYTLTVQANPTGGGSAADSIASGPYEEGASVEVIATANAGYEIVSWTSSETIVSTEASFVYTMPAANTILTANFLPEGYVPVATAEELNNIRNSIDNTFGAGTAYEGTYTGGLDKKYIQVADIELNTAPYNTGAGWTPFGTAWNLPFNGKYDGNGYTIDNLFINRPTTDGIGFFGYVGESGQLIRIVLNDANVTGAEEVGILAGANEGHIDNCSSAGQVTGRVDTGGLVGINYNFDKTIDKHALIKDSHSLATVQNSDLYGGGLVGSNYGKVENCYAAGAVTGSLYANGGYAGGLAGNNYGMITHSHAAGSVNGDGAGGLVGENYKNVMASKYEAQILNSYATGTVSGECTIGGLVGYSFEGSISNSYATGDVSGKEAVAGLVGELGSGTLSNSFALNSQITRTSGGDTHFGRIIGWEVGTLNNNYARVDMIFVNIDYTPVSNADGVDGKSIYNWIIEDGELTDYTEVMVPEMGGIVTIEGELKFGEQLTANISGITYTPLTASDVPTYQWHRSGEDIMGATAATYTLVEADISETISVTVTADGTNAMGSVTSEATAAVEKADGPAAPAAPAEASRTHDSITLIGNAHHEFSIDEGITWQSDNEFSGLSPNNEYSFMARIEETPTRKASQPSEAFSIQTLQIVAQLTAGIEVEFDGRDYFVLNPASGYLLSVYSINSPTGDLITWGPNNEDPSNIKAFLDNWFDANIQKKNVVQDFGGQFEKIGLISTTDWNNRPAGVTNPDYIRIGRTWTSTKAGSTTHVYQIKYEDGSLIQSNSSSSYGDVRHAIKILSDLAVDTVGGKLVVIVP